MGWILLTNSMCKKATPSQCIHKGQAATMATIAWWRNSGDILNASIGSPFRQDLHLGGQITGKGSYHVQVDQILVPLIGVLSHPQGTAFIEK